jgi:hypothetical protein
MRNATQPLGPIPIAPKPAAPTVLRGLERDTLLAKLKTVFVASEDETLLEDEFGQPWLDQPSSTGRELLQVSWREVCVNWPDAMACTS